MATDSAHDQQVLVLAPLANDFATLAAVIAAQDEQTRAADAATLDQALGAGAGAIVLTEEAITPPVLDALLRWAADQPDWSALPVIVLMHREHHLSEDLRRILDDGRGTGLAVTLLDRPAKPAVFANAVAAALQSRRRQYRIRDQIRELDRNRDHMELLAREVQHRAQNTLTRLQAVLRQTARHADNLEDFVPMFESRVLALARGQTLLSRQHWRGARLRELVQGEVSAIGVDADARLQADGEDLMLSNRAATALQLAFHELATNAAKYGALSEDHGCVQVHWTLTGGPPPEQLAIVWQECDGPPVAPPTRQGFGSTLINRALTTEFAGTATLSFEPHGVRCELRLPIDGLLIEG